MKRKLCTVMLMISMLGSAIPAYAGQMEGNAVSAVSSSERPIEEEVFEESVKADERYSYRGETNFENVWIRNLTDTEGRSVSTRGETGKVKIIINGRVTRCPMTMNTTDYLARRFGSNAKVEIITRDCDNMTTNQLKADMEDKLSGTDSIKYNRIFANYDKAHITGDSYGNTDFWAILSKISNGSASNVLLPLITVVDSQNMIKYCSISNTGEDLAPLASYVESMVGGTVPSGPSEPGFFSDVTVAPGNWKYDSIKYVYEKGIMNGINGTTRFDPDEPMTRAMFATVLYRMAGEPAVQYENKFADVPNGIYYCNAVIWAYKRGIVQGVDGGTRYGSNENVTREQMAKMLMEYAREQGYSTSERAELSVFPDKENLGGWAVEYMQWAVGSGIIGGKNLNGTFYLDPKGDATRAECAAMLTRFMKKYQ